MKRVIILLLPLSMQGMQQRRNPNTKSPHPRTYVPVQKPAASAPSARPTSFEDLQKELFYALNLNDIIRTRRALQDLQALNKKYEELQCLEIEAHNTTRALVYAFAKKSKTTANETAKVEIGATSIHDGDAHNRATIAFQKAIQEHAKALTNQELVANFFTRQTPSYQLDDCQFTLKTLHDDELPL